MKSKKLTKLLIGVLAGVLVIGGAAVYAATAANGTDYTVTFDASTGEFSFSDEAMVTVDGVSYPNLFQIEGAMPGDTFEWKITARVINMDNNTVKLYITTGDYNDDYKTLMTAKGGDGNALATLAATFDANNTVHTIPTNFNSAVKLMLNLNFANSASRIASFQSYAEDENYGVYLGQFSGADAARTIDMRFNLSENAGNELSNLNAEVHWVFTAEVIPPSDTGGGGTGGGGTGGGELIDIEEEIVPLGDRPGLTAEDFVYMLENGQTLQFGDLEITPDMLETPWMFETVDHYAYLIGYGDDTIRPFGFITRAEMATVLFRCMREELRDYWWYTVNDFNDIPSNAWYNNAISTLYNAGIVHGYEDGSFRPDAPITRAEFCAMIGRYYSMLLGQDVSYSDIHGHWAEDIIRSVSEYGFVEGYEDGTFRPQDELRRCEAATIMNRVLDRHATLGGLSPDMKQWQDNMDTSAWYYLDMQEASNSHEYSLNTGHEVWTEWLSGPQWGNLEKQWSEKNAVRIYRSTDGGIGS